MITNDFTQLQETPLPNGCAYYRMALPGQELVDRGVDVIFGRPVFHREHGYGVEHEDGGLFNFNVAMFKLMMHRDVVVNYRLMRGQGTRIIVDVDDFHFGIPESNVAFLTTNPRVNPGSNRMFYEMGIRAADRVTVSTDFLGDFYSMRHRDVVVVRNAVQSDSFTMVEQPEVPTLGWVGGTLWRSNDVEILAEWLPQFVKDHVVRVHHAGHIAGDPHHFGVRAGLKRVDTRPMSLINDYPSMFRDIHIGLVPLNMVPFSEAKSYLKGLEFAASGIPFIASPTREYRLLHERGLGRIASTPDEWRDHATELLDPDVRTEEAQRQRALVESEFDIATMGDKWVSAILG